MKLPGLPLRVMFIVALYNPFGSLAAIAFRKAANCAFVTSYFKISYEWSTTPKHPWLWGSQALPLPKVTGTQVNPSGGGGTTVPWTRKATLTAPALPGQGSAGSEAEFTCCWRNGTVAPLEFPNQR